MGYQFRFDVVMNYYDWFLKGLGLTFSVSLVAFGFALLLGLFIALLRMAKFKPVSALAIVYIDIFRGMPLFVFIIWLYYGFAMVVGINFPPLTAGVICLSIMHSAYLAEIYRSGIEAIPRGQWEAAASLGFTSFQTFSRIVMPQALRIIIPPAANMYVGMLKDTSLLAVIGLWELMRQTQLIVSLTFRPFEFYTTTAAIYIVLTLIFSNLAKLVEIQMKKSDTRLKVTKQTISVEKTMDSTTMNGQIH
jgi:His/Glu/Gln/Arg/opine family amino acid ABC transporter permease subunit